MAPPSLFRPTVLVQCVLFTLVAIHLAAVDAASNYTSSATTNSILATRSKSIPEFRRKAAQLRKDRKIDLHTTVGAKIEVNPTVGSSAGTSLSATDDSSIRYSQPIKSTGVSGAVGQVSARSMISSSPIIDNGFRPLYPKSHSYLTSSSSSSASSSMSSLSPASSQPTQLLNAHPNDRPTHSFFSKPKSLSSSFYSSNRSGSNQPDHFQSYSLSESRPSSQVFARRQRDYGDAGSAASPSEESESGDSSSAAFPSSNHEEIDDSDDFRSAGPSSSGSSSSSSSSPHHHHSSSSGPGLSGSEDSGPHGMIGSSGPPGGSGGSYDFSNAPDDDGPPSSGSHGPRENSIEDSSSSLDVPDHDSHHDSHHDHHHHGPPPHLQSSHHHHSELPTTADLLRGYSAGLPPPPFGPPMPLPSLGGRHLFPLGPPPPPYAHLHPHRSPIGAPSSLPPMFGSPLPGPFKSGGMSSARSRYPPPPSSSFGASGGLSPVHPISLSGSSNPFAGRYRGFSPAGPPPSMSSASSSSSSSSSSPSSSSGDDFGSSSSLFSPFGSSSFSFEPFSSGPASGGGNSHGESFHTGSATSGLPTAAALTGASPFGFKSNDQLSYLNQPDLLGFSALNSNNWYLNQPYLPMMMKQAGVPMMANSMPNSMDSSASGSSAPSIAGSPSSGTGGITGDSNKEANKDKDSGKTRNRLRFNLNRLQSIRLNNIKLPSFLSWASRNSSTTTPASSSSNA